MFLRCVFLTYILEVAHKLFFLAIYRNHRIFLCSEGFDFLINVVELCIPIRMFFTDLVHFLILLKAIAHFFQKISDLPIPDLESFTYHLISKISQTFCSPAQWAHGVSIC